MMTGHERFVSEDGMFQVAIITLVNGKADDDRQTLLNVERVKADMMGNTFILSLIADDQPPQWRTQVELTRDGVRIDNRDQYNHAVEMVVQRALKLTTT